ncbi:hypothetical protein GF324_02035, partial [bacterium]|nr:hypothetical protein [bacterium]
MDVRTAIEQRRSVHSYDPSRKLTDRQIADLVRLSTLAPSSFNLNHWRFVVVTSDEGKRKLHAASLNQRHLLDASAVLVILGKVNAHEDMPQFTQDWIKKGYYPDDEHLMKVSKGFYGSDP